MFVDTIQMELALHTLLCGRSRKKIKAIESSTDTAIYFPPTFPGIHLYAPDGAERRPPDEIVITGPSEQRIFLAKTQLQELSNGANTYVKDVRITPTKIDHLVLQRLDKIQSIMEAHGSFLLLPAIGQQVSLIRVQGLDVLNVERTIRDVMGLVSSQRRLWCFLIDVGHAIL
jgi:KH domain